MPHPLNTMSTMAHFQPEAFETASIRAAAWGPAVTRLLAAAVNAVEPATAVRRHLHRNGTTLTIGSHTCSLEQYERVFLVAAGKASIPMAQAAADVLAAHLTDGLIITKDTGQPVPDTPCPVFVAGHPIPDERGTAATRRLAHLLEQAGERDLVLVLLSGGGSALMTLPAAGISLDALQHTTSLLLSCGASINEINCLRKHLDTVKGGGLARMAAPATVATLILSDVVGNPLDVIASGPTVPDPTTFADALGVLQRYNLLEHTPGAVIERLRAGQRGEIADTPGPDDAVFARVQHVLVGSNEQAAQAALAAATAAGMHALILTTSIQGEACVVGSVLAAIARELATTGCPGGAGLPALPRPACLIVGGETTVTLRGNGHGGRNQELALAAVQGMAGLHDTVLVTLATDGEDGPTDAAGAVVTGDTLARAQQQGLDPAGALADNDSASFFAALNDGVRPGPTRTNVNDLVLVCAF